MKTDFIRTFGQQDSKKNIEQTLKTDSAPSVTLIYGARGLGQNAMALDMAALLVCLDRQNKPCGKCSACLELKHKTSHIVQYVFPLPESSQKNKNARIDGTLKKLSLVMQNPYGYSPGVTEHISISQIRDLKESMSYAETEGRRRVVIFFFPENLGDPAANALLKMLEEPPEGTSFLLASESRERLLGTLLSRCINLKLTPLSDEELGRFAREIPGIEKQWISLCRQSPGQLMHLTSYESEEFQIAAEFLKVTLEKSWSAFSGWMDSVNHFTEMDRSVRIIELSQEIFRMLNRGGPPFPEDEIFTELKSAVAALSEPHSYTHFLEHSIKSIKRYCRPQMALLGNFLKFEMT